MTNKHNDGYKKKRKKSEEIVKKKSINNVDNYNLETCKYTIDMTNDVIDKKFNKKLGD